MRKVTWVSRFDIAAADPIQSPRTTSRTNLTPALKQTQRRRPLHHRKLVRTDPLPARNSRVLVRTRLRTKVGQVDLQSRLPLRRRPWVKVHSQDSSRRSSYYVNRSSGVHRSAVHEIPRSCLPSLAYQGDCVRCFGGGVWRCDGVQVS